MSNGWSAGDLAECIFDGWTDPHFAPPECSMIYVALAPRKGSRWKVAAAAFVYREEERGEIWYLWLDGQPEDKGFKASFFRKITPPADEECEPDFAARLRRIKPMVPA